MRTRGWLVVSLVLVCALMVTLMWRLAGHPRRAAQLEPTVEQSQVKLSDTPPGTVGEGYPCSFFLGVADSGSTIVVLDSRTGRVWTSTGAEHWQGVLQDWGPLQPVLYVEGDEE